MSYDALETSQRGGKPIELYRFSAGSTRTYWYTSADEEQTYLGDLYVPEVLSRGEIAYSPESDSGGVEVGIPRTNPVAALFVPYLPEPELALVIYRKHRGDPETIVIFTGKVASSVFSASRCTLTCLPLREALRRRIPLNTFQSQCNWPLYSGPCGVAKASFATVGTVSAISEDTVDASAFSPPGSGWFNNGYVERFNGERRWIINHVGSTLTLLSPFVGLVVGESLTAYAGCDRTEAVCQSKFSNIVNHLGFSRLPTKNPFTEGLT